MSVNKLGTDESTTPDLQHVDLADVDMAANRIRYELRELLRSDPYVSEGKVILLFQYALYERVLLNDDFMNKVFTPNFRAGIEDILRIYRTIYASKDKEVSRENIHDRAETITAFLLNAIHLAKEGLRDTRYVGADVNAGVAQVAKDIGEILYSIDGRAGKNADNDKKDDDISLYVPSKKFKKAN